MLLRPRQKTFVENSVTALHEHGNTLGVAPTGSGKTVMLSAVTGEILKNTSKACILAHRDELTAQNSKKFSWFNPDISTSIFDATTKSWEGDATFAMVQTLSRDSNLSLIPKLDLLVIDEAHHAIADGYQRIIRRTLDINPKCFIFGVTATPMRGDKKGLRPIFSNVADQITLEEMIRSGHLVPPRTFVIDVGVQDELRHVRKVASDFDMGEVDKIMNKRPVTDAVVKHWKEQAGNRKTIVFCSTVDHARNVCDAFNNAGVNAVLVYGEMSKFERERALASYEHGDTQVVVNVAVLTEGYDYTPTSCVVLLRPSSYRSTMIQMVGRGLRTVDPAEFPGVKEFRPWDVKTRKYQAPNPRPLYNQQGMLTTRQVILVEGEKSAQSLINIGICATTAMNGAKAPIDKTDWSPLIGKEVIIWPDKDKPGWEYAENVAKALQEIGVAKLSILYPPEDKPDKWDAADSVMEGMDIEAFLSTTKRNDIKIRTSGINIYDWCTDQYKGKAPEQKFLVDGTIPMGMVSLLAAMGDTGKGMLTLNLALQVATGTQNGSIIPQAFSFGNRVSQFGTAVIFTAEDDKSEIHRRLEKLDPHNIRDREEFRKKLLVIPLPNAGGVFPIIHATKEGSAVTSKYIEVYKQLSKVPDLKLIVFDPLSSFIHADVNADPAAGSFSTGILAALASETGAALLVPHHMRKPASGKPITSSEQARDAIRGTSALVDGVRLAYAMWPAPDDHQAMVFKMLNEKFERNAVYQGAVVKSNSPADRTIRTYLRSACGLLVDVTQKLEEIKTPADALKDMLVFSIARAARNGHPFTHTGGSGIFQQRNR